MQLNISCDENFWLNVNLCNAIWHVDYWNSKSHVCYSVITAIHFFKFHFFSLQRNLPIHRFTIPEIRKITVFLNVDSNYIRVLLFLLLQTNGTFFLWTHVKVNPFVFFKNNWLLTLLIITVIQMLINQDLNFTHLVIYIYTYKHYSY